MFGRSREQRHYTGVMHMDWSILEKVGIAGVALGGFWIMYKIFVLVMNQWNASTEALNRNTKGYEQLSKVFEIAHERDLEFQKEVMHLAKDTNRKVAELHNELVNRKNTGGVNSE